jgi:hypothetical protein
MDVELESWACGVVQDESNEGEAMKEERRKSLRGLLCASGLLALGLAGVWSGRVEAQTANAEPTPLKLTVRPGMTLADVKGGELGARIQPPQNGVGQRLEAGKNIGKLKRNASAATNGHGSGLAFYPGDLTYQGGAVLQTVVSHDIYVNCTASCFGFPAVFLTNWGNSGLMHVNDEFVGTHASHRYTVGPGGIIGYPVSGPLGPNDIVTLVYTAAAAFGSGYGDIYHIFFAPGIDVCADKALTICYSPDNVNTFYFCAFHGSVDFTDIGHVLFSVEPYANVKGCQVNQPSPNSAETDSQANTLSHELEEAITDPDGDAWWNAYDLALFGNENADECAQAFFAYATTVLNGHPYEVQPIYSNQAHACVFKPLGD